LVWNFEGDDVEFKVDWEKNEKIKKTEITDGANLELCLEHALHHCRWSVDTFQTLLGKIVFED